MKIQSIRDRRLFLVLALPLLCGAYLNPCSRSVGTWPNFVEAGRSEGEALELTDTSGIRHVFFYIHWGDQWYDCLGSLCTFKGNTNARSDLQNAVLDGLKNWAGKDPGRQYNVNIVLNVHQQRGNPRVGPSHLHFFGERSPADSAVKQAFNEFYDEIYEVMRREDFRAVSGDFWELYNIGSASWLISIGNEVDLFMQDSGDWSDYANFASSADIHIKAHNPQLLSVYTGVCQTYYGSAFANPAGARDLHTIGDTVVMTYYPLIDCDAAPNLCPDTRTGVHMAEPAQVHGDFGVMGDYLSQVNAQRAVAATVTLQEVGYPTDGLACPLSLSDDCSPDQRERAQADFVDQLFNAFRASAGVVDRMTWWSLFDYTGDACDLIWNRPGDPDAAPMFCHMGLARSHLDTKPAFQRFRAGIDSL